MDLNHLVVGLSSLAIIPAATLGVRAWLDHRALAAARALPLPGGAAGLSTALQRRPLDRSGRIMLVLGGSFGTGFGTKLLTILDSSGLDGAIGSILPIELDTNGIRNFNERMPSIFQDRLETYACSTLSAGLGNRSPDEVRALRAIWEPELRRAVVRVAQRHQRLHHAAPGLILVPYGPGGQAMLGVKVVEILHEYFPDATYAGVTILPNDTPLRDRVPQIHAAFREAGMGVTFIADNRRDPVKNDTALAVGLAAFIGSSAEADITVEFNNALRLLGHEAPGALVTCKAAIRMLPAHRFQPHPSLEPKYFVMLDLLRDATRTALAEVQGTDDTALGPLVELGQDRIPTGSVTFDFVATAVFPEHLKTIEDDLVEGTFGPGRSKANHHFQVVSIGTAIGDDTKGKVCPVVVVSVGALSDPEGGLAKLTQRIPPYLPRPVAPVDSPMPLIAQRNREEDHHVS